ncbi:hypothetical protein [Elizabethkingia ursingii]
MKYLGIATIVHHDGKTKIKAKFWQRNNKEIYGEYVYDKMTYSQTISEQIAVQIGLIKTKEL